MTTVNQLRFFLTELADCVGWEPWEVDLEFEELLMLAEAREWLYRCSDDETGADVYHRLLNSHQDLIYREAMTEAGSDQARAVAEMERELACFPSGAVPGTWG